MPEYAMVVFAAPQLREYEELRNDPSSFEGRARTDEAVVDTSGVPGADVERGRLCGLCPLTPRYSRHARAQCRLRYSFRSAHTSRICVADLKIRSFALKSWIVLCVAGGELR